MPVEEEQSSSTHGAVPEPQRFSGQHALAAQDVIVEMQPIPRPKRIIRQQVSHLSWFRYTVMYSY